MVDDVTRSRLFSTIGVLHFPWQREMSAATFREMAMSSTKMKAAVDTHGAAQMTADIDALCARFFPAGPVVTPYVTETYAFRSAR